MADKHVRPQRDLTPPSELLAEALNLADQAVFRTNPERSLQTILAAWSAGRPTSRQLPSQPFGLAGRLIDARPDTVPTRTDGLTDRSTLDGDAGLIQRAGAHSHPRPPECANTPVPGMASMVARDNGRPHHDPPEGLGGTVIVSRNKSRHWWHAITWSVWRRRWLLSPVLVGVILLTPSVAVFLGQAVHPPHLNTPGSPSIVVPPLSSGAGVQACAAAPQSAGLPVVGAQAGWTSYTDPSGFHVTVPTGWRTWRDGALLCFRDPLSLRAAAVISNGALSGSAVDLLSSTVTDWTDAASLVNYHQIDLRPRMVGDDGAQLEYTYDGHGLGMHGITLMQRSAGQVYQLCWLSTDYAWPSEQGLVQRFQASFGLDQ